MYFFSPLEESETTWIALEAVSSLGLDGGGQDGNSFSTTLIHVYTVLGTKMDRPCRTSFCGYTSLKNRSMRNDTKMKNC